jgi:hypothetical protein
MTSDVCRTCEKPREGHEKFQHPFNDGSLANPLARPAASITPPAHPFDPVLRQALIDKGVLTPDDLRSAQDKIDAVTGRLNDDGAVGR